MCFVSLRYRGFSKEFNKQKYNRKNHDDPLKIVSIQTAIQGNTVAQKAEDM